MSFPIRSSCIWKILRSIPFTEAYVSTEYRNLGPGKARTGREQILSINFLNDLSCSSFTSKGSPAPLPISLLRGCVVPVRFGFMRRYRLQRGMNEVRFDRLVGCFCVYEDLCAVMVDYQSSELDNLTKIVDGIA